CWGADELRNKSCRCVSPRRQLCRADSQRRKSGGLAGSAGGKIRGGPQSQDSEGARVSGTGQTARGCRRGDRMMGWMAPLGHLSAKLLSVRISSEWEPSMGEVTTIGLDLAKHVFQVHGVDAGGATVLRKQLRRAQVLAFFSRLPPCLVGVEACATAHYWGRELRALGHEV